MRANTNAPIFIRREITIFAPPEKVWDWLSRVDLWEDWHPDITASRWLADEGPSGKFKWRQGPIGFTSLITSWREVREIGWVGTAYSAVVRHVFRLEGDFRQTRVTSEQSYEGFPISLLSPIIRRLAERSSETWLAALKTRLESVHEGGRRRAPPPRPPSLPSARVDRFRV